MSASWRLAPVLHTLRAEVDAVWPLRSKASDGTIGDQSHQSRNSDHNPNKSGVVRAWDLTRDDHHGPPLPLFAEWLRAFGRRGSDRLQRGSYLILDGRICSFSSMWQWSAYKGSDPHTSHLHISCPVDAQFYEITRPWEVTRALRVKI